ncbi:MAG TPA: hypothetical protein VJT31_28560 [Rugosimonospora sp.]|nr:hypothetical protein [Rugosimonospora sp.]
MGRPEKPISAAGPAADFARALRDVRRARGNPPYRDLAARAKFSAPALSTAASGARLPSWEVTAGYLQACEVPEAEFPRWRTQWEKARIATRQSRSAAVRASVSAGVGIAGDGFVLPTVPVPSTVWYPEEPGARLARLATVEDFRRALDQLRTDRRLSFRDVSSRSHLAELPDRTGNPVKSSWLTTTTVHQTLHGSQPLTTRFVCLFINACGGTSTDVDLWLRAWMQVRRRERAAKAALASLAGVRDPADDASSLDTVPANTESMRFALRTVLPLRLRDVLRAQVARIGRTDGHPRRPTLSRRYAPGAHRAPREVQLARETARRLRTITWLAVVAVLVGLLACIAIGSPN